MRSHGTLRRAAATLPLLAATLALSTMLARQGLSAPAVQSQVMIHNHAFMPDKLTVHRGTTVTWINRDNDAHTVTSSAGPEKFQSPGLDTGEKFAFIFKKAGTYQYFCSVHPYMRGTIIVQ